MTFTTAIIFYIVYSFVVIGLATAAIINACIARKQSKACLRRLKEIYDEYEREVKEINDRYNYRESINRSVFNA